MNTRNLLGTFTIAAALCGATATHANASLCGDPPGNITWSDHFYQAQAKYYASTMGIETGGEVVYDGIPIKGHGNYQQGSSGWESLTIEQAHEYIQQEYRDKEVNLAAECGYRMCKLAEVGDTSGTGLSLMAQICNGVSPGAENPDAGTNLRPILGDKTRPAFTSVAFDSDAPVTSYHTIHNDSPFLMKISWYVEDDLSRAGKHLLKVEKFKDTPRGERGGRLPRIIRLKPFEGFTFRVTASRPDRAMQKPKIWFGLDKSPQFAGNLQYVLLRDVEQLKQRHCRDWDLDGYCRSCMFEVEFNQRVGQNPPLQNVCERMRPGASVVSTFSALVYDATVPPNGAWNSFIEIYLQTPSDTAFFSHRYDSNYSPFYGSITGTVPANGSYPNNIILTACQWGADGNHVCQTYPGAYLKMDAR